MALSDHLSSDPQIPFGPFSMPRQLDEAEALFEALLHGQLQGDIAAAVPIALPDGAELEIRLLDLSEIDAPIIVLANETIGNVRCLPHRFHLPYDHYQIRRGSTYSISATIRVNCDILFGNAATQLVFTSSSEAHVRLLMRPVG